MGTVLAAWTLAAGIVQPGSAKLQDLVVNAPAGWRLVQEAWSEGTTFALFSRTDQPNVYVRLYAARGPAPEVRDFFVNGSTVTRDSYDESRGGQQWSFVETKKTSNSRTTHVAGFTLEARGGSYYGYASGPDAQTAKQAAHAILDASRTSVRESLTNYGYTGQKHYFGFAEQLDGFMGNETKFDVKHTHDIFTTTLGGEYKSNYLTDTYVDGAKIKGVWRRVGQEIKPDDMYVQYSSGHGFERGLGVGVSYDEIRDNALGFKARETIVFIMACHSGGLIDSFKRKESEWKNFREQGKALYVLASSRTDQLSSTGPGRDGEEPGGPNGSAGSAFGHALWKALIGHADGFVDGVADGFLALDEIDSYVKHKTKAVGGHDPVSTGSYEPGLIMNRVPAPRHELLEDPT